MKNRISIFVVTLAFLVSVLLMPVSVQAVTIYQGVDAYEYDTITDYQALKNTGVNVFIQKASQGLWHDDKELYTRYDNLVKYNYHIGFYHFADNSNEPVAEAQHFLSRIQGLWHDTVLFLDIENQDNWTKEQAIAYVNKFVSYVQSQGYNIGLYTGMSFYYEYLAGNIDSTIPIWLASYGKQPEQFPNLVSWQYSENGRLNGVHGDIDMNYFNGSIFDGSSDYIRSIQHDLQRVSCMEAGESNATGKLDLKTKLAIQQFRYVVGLSSSTSIDDSLVNALNVITHRYTTGEGWSNDVCTVKFLQWYLGMAKTGVYDSTMTSKVKQWQIVNKVWSKTGANGIIYSKDWSYILK